MFGPSGAPLDRYSRGGPLRKGRPVLIRAPTTSATEIPRVMMVYRNGPSMAPLTFKKSLHRHNPSLGLRRLRRGLPVVTKSAGHLLAAEKW